MTKRLFRVHDGCPEEYAELIVAEDERQARIIGWLRTNLNDADELSFCKAEAADTYYEGDKIPQEEIDELPWGVQDINNVEEARMMRDLGWKCDGDETCECCGLNTLDGLFPLCKECLQCEYCGHEESCPNKGRNIL